MRPAILRAAFGGLHGSMTALVTPFRDGEIDEQAFMAHCERQIKRGAAALVPAGTTGEAPTLSHEEQLRVIRLTVEAAWKRVPVIAGAGSNCTRTAVTLVEEAESAGADAVLSVVPYYNRPTQEGLWAHFRAVAASTSLPILLYDVPARTGMALTLETIIRLAELPNIAGIKDATGDLARAERIRRDGPADFMLLCGDDSLAHAYLALGARGSISVTANVAPALCASFHRAWFDRDLERFQQLRDCLSPLHACLSVETNPIPVKWAMAAQGLIKPDLRLPLAPLSADHEGIVRHALDTCLPYERAEIDSRWRKPAPAAVGMPLASMIPLNTSRRTYP